MLQNFPPIALAALLFVASAAAAQDPAAERSRIEAEIQRLNGDHVAAESACKERFAVTSCVEEVQLRRRETLGPLRSRLLALDDAERRQRASARLAVIERKRQAQRENVPEPPPPPRPAFERPPLAASAPLVAVRRDEAGAARLQAASAAAAQRVAAARRRHQQAEEDAARVREKLLERERSGRAAAPLPVPAIAR